jgi:small subunit ribosomal protein S3
MEERKFIKLKKEEFGIKEAIRRNLGMGKISRLDIEYTPVGEKIIVSTSRPGLVIGRRGEKIDELTQLLKRRFKLENPHIEIKEIDNPLFDSQLVADEIAMALERMGNLKFKVIAYRKLQDIMKEGALGCELRITGKLPSERARSWRFAQGYLKKAGESRKEIDRAEATALTKTGIIGVKVAIMNPQARIYDKIDIDDKMKLMIKGELNLEKPEEETDTKSKKKSKKKATKAVKKVIEAKEKSDKAKKPKEKASLLEKGEAKVIEESSNLKIKPEEDGTAMLVAEELEEGVPGKQIDKDIKESIKNEKEEKEKLDKAKKPEEVKK